MAVRGGRPARGRVDAAGHLLHLQPGRLRRRRSPVSDRRRPTDHARRATSDPGHRRGQGRGPVRRRSTGALLRRLAHRAGGGTRGSSRRSRAAVQGSGRGLLRRRPGEGGVRHRDALARHQHAGPFGGDREAHQVQRRTPRDPDGGRVHPAHREGRTAGDRRGRPRGRALVSLRPLLPGRRAGIDPDVRPHVVVPTHLQHDGQPRPPVPAGPGPPPAQPVLRPVPRRRRPGAPRGPARANDVRAGRCTASRPLRSRRRRGVPPPACRREPGESPG